MWHNAVLSKIEKTPPLSDFIPKKNEMKGINERAIISRLKAYQRQRENNG